MDLEEYKKRRNFSETPEPGPEKKESGESLIFVIQKHDATRLHYDFRIELEGVLKSWAVPKGPSFNPEDKRLAIMTEDHPYDYKDFEGIIPEKNYGAGPVIIWDEGTYRAEGASTKEESEKKIKEGIQKGHVSLELFGKKVKGKFVLIKTEGKGDNAWLLIKQKDEFVSEEDITKDDRSVRSGKTVEEIIETVKQGNKKYTIQIPNVSDVPASEMPENVSPMLATRIDEPFDREGWLFEIKWDGYRALAEVRNGDVQLYSRNQTVFNAQFPQIVSELSRLPYTALLDGEVVVLDEQGKPNFQWLQDYGTRPRGTLVYYVFDVLHLNGHDLSVLPLKERKEILKLIIPNDSHIIKYTEHIEEKGIEFFHAAASAGIEGVIAKDAESRYQFRKRSKSWRKVKRQHTQEAVICGFTEPKGGRKNMGALVLGVYEQGSLKYIGHTGGGFTDKELKDMRRKLESVETERSPFESVPQTNAQVHWVKPQFVCEIAFSEWTEEGIVRQPIFVRVRDDKVPEDVHIEKELRSPSLQEGNTIGEITESKEITVNRKKIQISNYKKVYWPEDGYTKGDLVEYYKTVARVMLPYVQDRPQVLYRFPHGIRGESFYQKNVGDLPPAWIQTVDISSDTEDRILKYIVATDEASMLYLVNLGCIEINPWNSRVQHLEKPDYLVLDLDPVDIPFKAVRNTALYAHSFLDHYGIPNYCKTSGKTGLHIYVPLGAQYTNEQARQFTEIIARMIHRRIPTYTSVERDPRKRKGKVYLDFLQNRRGQTLAAPYSVRPVRGATISTPVEWKEVEEGIVPEQFTMKNVPDRLQEKGDIWKPVIGPGVDLISFLEKLSE